MASGEVQPRAGAVDKTDPNLIAVLAVLQKHKVSLKWTEVAALYNYIVGGTSALTGNAIELRFRDVRKMAKQYADNAEEAGVFASVVTTPLAGTPKRTPKTKTSQTLASAIKRKAVKDDGDEDDEAPVSAKKVKSSAESDVDEV